MIKSNVHTHTTFSDGKHTAREVIQSAIGMGLDTLGFSDHSYTDFDLSYCMKENALEAYKEEIFSLKKEYGDKINILCGYELDCFSDPAGIKGLDYFICGCHYVKSGDNYYPVDSSAEETLRGINEGFNGSQTEYARAYFEALLNGVRLKPLYAAHFDLPVKYNVLDESAPAYRSLALEALDQVIATDVPVEINTGAMARGLKDVLYPRDFLVKRLAEKGGKVILGSDCHHRDNLLFAFPQAIEYIKANGIKSVLVFEKGRLTEKNI